jgi:hypothetical protein
MVNDDEETIWKILKPFLTSKILFQISNSNFSASISISKLALWEIVSTKTTLPCN